MAALPYMQLYIADYLADTMHLSTEEHGAYLLLIFNYWQTGKPIPKNRLAKIARVSKERWPDIEEVLSEFFECAGESWAHLRIERDLENIATSPGGRKLSGSNDNSDYKGRIYFITGPDLDGVKIGYSKNPWARLSELRSSYGSNLSVVATIKTVDKPEATIHSILSEYHVGNGWYQKSECINSLILAISASNITTVDEVYNYVANYSSDSNKNTVGATTATNKDPDKDLKDQTPYIAGASENGPPPDESPPQEPDDDFWTDDPSVKFPMVTTWQPSPDFKRHAAVWGNILDGPDPGYTPQDLASFTTYWKAEGKAFHHVQWEQKFSRHLASQRGGSPPGAKPKRQRQGAFEPSGNYGEKPPEFN